MHAVRGELEIGFAQLAKKSMWTSENIRFYFVDDFTDIYSRFEPELVFNMDETFISAVERTLTVIVPSDLKKAPMSEGGHFNHHITLVMCIAADGTAIKRPTVILPLKNLPPLSKEVEKAFLFSGSDSGWINQPIWSEWITESFIPFVQLKRAEIIAARGHFDSRQVGRAAFFFDSHASRIDDKSFRAMETAGIVSITIPSHSSHILQPLDCGVNNILKAELARCKQRGMIVMDKGVPEYRQSLLYSLISAYHRASDPISITRAFGSCGIVPWNPSIVLKDPSKVTPSMFVPPAPDSPSILQSISGTIVHPEVIEKYKKMKAEEEARKKQALEEKAAKKEAKEKEAAAKLEPKAKEASIDNQPAPVAQSKKRKPKVQPDSPTPTPPEPKPVTKRRKKSVQ